MAAVETPDWVDEAVSLRRQGLSEREIAESVGKAPSTVHSRLAKYDAAMEGTPIDPADAARLAAAAGDSSGAEIPGQTTVEEQVEGLHDGSMTVVAPGDAEPGFDRAAFEAEAGEPVGPMPPRPAPEATTVYVEEIRIDGTTQVSLDLGGKRATSASCSLSGKVVVDGSLRKGDVLTGTFRAVVRGAAVKDKVDRQTGIVTEAAEKFSADLVDVVIDSAGAA
jgi:hypothetical protein